MRIEARRSVSHVRPAPARPAWAAARRDQVPHRQLDQVLVAIGPALVLVPVVQVLERVPELAPVLQALEHGQELVRERPELVQERPVSELDPELARERPESELGRASVLALQVSELGQASARRALEHDQASVPVLRESEHDQELVSVLRALEHGRARCPDWAKACREWEIARGNCPRIDATICNRSSNKDRGTFKIAVRTGPTIVARTGRISRTTTTGITATGITGVGTDTEAVGGIIYGTIILPPPRSA